MAGANYGKYQRGTSHVHQHTQPRSLQDYSKVQPLTISKSLAPRHPRRVKDQLRVQALGYERQAKAEMDNAMRAQRQRLALALRTAKKKQRRPASKTATKKFSFSRH